MRAQQITVAHMTPALGQLLYGGRRAKSSESEKLSCLRYVFFGGDALTRRHVERMTSGSSRALHALIIMAPRKRPRPWDIMSSTSHERDQLRERIPLGKGIEGVQLLVLNPARKLAGIGELGEIYVRTPYLTKGYLKDER